MEASRARGGDAGPSSGSARPRSGGAAAGEGAGDQRTAPGGEGEAVYEAVHYDGNAQECGHVVTTACVQNGVRSVLRYAAERVVGNGSFGVVFQATCVESRETVAIKRVLQDKRFKNRELQIMRLLDHPNVVKLKHSFYSTAEREDVYLNLVLEFVPDTVYRIIKHYSKRAQRMPHVYVKVYMFQMFCALAHIHAMGVCHRDIKPQNLLVDTATHTLKLCDFGSAKILVRGERNISYICSRYYRRAPPSPRARAPLPHPPRSAPELIFGAADYTTAIDVWSCGCVAAELLIGQPLFQGESGVDQLVEIIKVLGTPTREEIYAMNPHYTEFKFPQIKAHPWSKVFHKHMPADAVALVAHLLQYSPGARLSALHVCAHPFFDELRAPGMRLPSGQPLPPLFNFGHWEAGEEELRRRVLPASMR